MTRVLVIGAGIAGAACANAVTAAGIDVRVLDRGRRPGGRLSHTLLDHHGGRKVDVGAAYFTVSDPEFEAVVQRWDAVGLVRPWTDTFDVLDADKGRRTTSGPTRWTSTHGGLTSLVDDLLGGEDVESRRTVERLGHDGKTLSVDGDPADVLVLAMPDPQALRILAPSVDVGDDEALAPARTAASVTYEPVIVVCTAWEERTWAVHDAAFVNGHPRLSFIIDDGARTGDGAAVLVAHTVPAFAASHLEDPVAVIEPVITDLIELLGLPEPPVAAREHRWSYAKPAGTHGSSSFLLTEAGIGLAGDSWCPTGSPRVESAWLSGAALGRAIVERLA